MKETELPPKNQPHKRNSNVELLRVLCMILIIAHHYSVHGGWDGSLVETTPPLNILFVQIISLGGKLAVNVFVLISGYYLVNQRFSVAKLITLMVNVSLYSIGILLVNNALGLVDVDSRLMLRSLMPTIHSTYWFFTTYILLYLASPLISTVLRSLDQVQHRRVVISLIVMWSFIPTLFNVTFGFSELMWFISLFIIAAYIRRFLTQPLSNIAKRWLLVVWGISVVSLVGSVILADLAAQTDPKALENALYLSNLNMLPTVLIAITAFVWVLGTKPRHSRIINFLAASVFGIYLFHDHPISRAILWGIVFRNVAYQTSPFLVLHAMMAVVIVFGVGVLVDTIKRQLLDQAIQRGIDKGLAWIEHTLNRIKSNLNRPKATLS
jgi:surface polysaccharide O-acyltransferase-like enzyme